jgi:hypothetical protein
MKTETPLSRRDFIAGVSSLALAAAFIPPAARRSPSLVDEFVIVNGWVLKRSEIA